MSVFLPKEQVKISDINIWNNTISGKLPKKVFLTIKIKVNNEMK